MVALVDCPNLVTDWMVAHALLICPAETSAVIGAGSEELLALIAEIAASQEILN